MAKVHGTFFTWAAISYGYFCFVCPEDGSLATNSLIHILFFCLLTVVG